ncbi:Holliday junction branch migration protein RuvA [Candidatus Manganitrophus noduliformans]|uniref:Holliday junction branch migration complex subunit RuvA n=1 Tax=Candidatus Manganitrophus noduliformans TaxID=2606439 RepID=A0A7X6ICK5_9BACT|nr:Holliday junction branch migration protein RuvA [Candidatus Manganitrophus noduliformans]NKE72773.1 Holliday junction branch migration protein RuvA [Candidatus Manganitrophus noduliformans]
MIAFLTGTILEKTPSTLIVEVHGIGYQIFIPLNTFYRLPEVKESVSLHVHTHVREDALQLYGFLSPLEKELFLLLLGISGVGPKVALGILSGMELTELVQALRDGNVDRLRAIPGVGPKTAGRLVLELREKVNALSLAGLQTPVSAGSELDKTKEDALSALVNLGYHRTEAKRTVDKIAEETGDSESVEGLIKKALKKLAKVG